MARGFYDRAYLASGYNNAANMLPLYLFNPSDNCPYFQDYREQFSIDFRYFRNEGVQKDGDGRKIPIGLPYAEWEFSVLSNEEFNYLADNFATNRLDGEVTFRTYNYESDTWENYNGIMDLSLQDRSSAWNGFEWRPFIIRFTKMRTV